MKYANRYGDMRPVLYRKGDKIELNGKYYEIVDVFDIPQLRLFLGTISAGGEGAKISADALSPSNDNRLVHTLVAVDAAEFEETIGTTKVIRSRSCNIYYYRPKEQPQWLSPDGLLQGYLNHEISPVEDPNEMYPVFVMRDDVPYFKAVNTYTSSITQYIRFHPIKEYKLAELTEKPAVYAPIAYQPKLRETK